MNYRKPPRTPFDPPPSWREVADLLQAQLWAAQLDQSFREFFARDGDAEEHEQRIKRIGRLTIYATVTARRSHQLLAVLGETVRRSVEDAAPGDSRVASMRRHLNLLSMYLQRAQELVTGSTDEELDVPEWERNIPDEEDLDA